MQSERAVVVFSGGQDSTTCLLQALQHYSDVYCITFNYGQRHSAEIEIAKKLANKLGVKAHKIMDSQLLNELAISSLTRDDIPVPKYSKEELPNTFVPGRNILFLTLAAIYAYQIGAGTIITGVCETDFSGYPDCRQNFITALNQAVNLGLDKSLTIKTPLMWLTKAETWALADLYHHLDTIRYETLTCYNGLAGDGCGECPACHLRQQGLNQYLANKDAVLTTLQQKNITI